MDAEVTLEVQVVFVESTTEGLVIDCLVVGSSLAPDAAGGASHDEWSGPRLAPGTPFSMIIECGPEDRGVDVARTMLDDWSRDERVVEATTSGLADRLVLRSGLDELVLDVD